MEEIAKYVADGLKRAEGSAGGRILIFYLLISNLCEGC